MSTSRYDDLAAHNARIRRHVHECMDWDCPFCEGIAEDRAAERDDEGWQASRAEDREFGGAW